jgi:lipoyl(octanoyl) transferase
VATLRFVYVGAGTPVPYQQAWELQRELHAARTGDEIDDTVLLLEHESVFTAGRRTEPGDRPVDGASVVEVDRGGRITWHGPGQLTGYPIVKLPGGVHVVDHVRRLEAALIGVCAELGVTTARVPGRTGVWVAGGAGPDRKVAAIGIRVARGVSMHGFAINCDCDLERFTRIVPCGITDATVTSLSLELARPVGVAEILPAVHRHLAAALGATDVAVEAIDLCGVG